jgi:hypothetical protein
MFASLVLAALVVPNPFHAPPVVQPLPVVSVVVHSGDSLTSIAFRHGSTWIRLFEANKVVKEPDVVQPGWRLVIPPMTARLAARAVLQEHSSSTVSPTGAFEPHTVISGFSSGGYPGGSFGACVVARESGGNSQVMNSSGHYGLYQFSASTWAAYGGLASAFGHASVAQQNAVFGAAIARGGQSNWSPYDGC